jgi:TRAP transporter TAXI family solute receptor
MIRIQGALLAATLAVCAACGGDGSNSGGSRQFMSIATAGTGGIYYPLGGALANLLSNADSGRRYTAEVTAGSVENVNRLRSGEVDVAMAIGTTIYEAYNGGTGFAEPHTRLRVVAPLYPNVTNVLVRRSGTSRSAGDFRGLRVSVGAPGSGTEQLAMQVLDAYGLQSGDVQVQYLSFAESSSALQDGAIDAAIISAGYPAPAVLEATTMRAARLLPIEGDAAQKMLTGYPYYIMSEIPAGAYPGVDASVKTVAVMNWVIANESLDEGVVMLILNTLRDQREKFIQVNDIAKQIDLQTLRSAPIPLHPAAQRWLDAMGNPGG